MTKIQKILAREILDSRGNPTVEAEVILTSGERGIGRSPSGASTGSREALELRDHDLKRFYGRGVLTAVANVTDQIQPALIGCDVTKQSDIDEKMIELDGTANKSRLGANATLAVSIACAFAAAESTKQALFQYLGHANSFLMPVPMMNIINGGLHANNNLDIQEFMIMPVGAKSFSQALRMGAEIFQTLKKLLIDKDLNVTVGDEGGFAPERIDHKSALDLICQAVEKSGYQMQKDICLALDIASSEFYKHGFYYLPSEKAQFTSQEFVNFMAELVDNYPIISIEDGMAENDWHGWDLLTKRLGNRIQLVGDDLFVTNTEILQKGINEHIANAILIKPNQIGTLTETLAAINLARDAKYNTIISHRSGETEDTSIADLAVATNAGQIKTGSLCRTDRIAKYNQLLRIEAILGEKAIYQGKIRL